MKKSIRMINACGGRTIRLRLPSFPERFLAEERLHPRQACWETLPIDNPATANHDQDVPVLAKFVSADSAHLDCRGSPALTNALLDEIERRGLPLNR